MRLLFDHSVPAPLRRELSGHDVTTAKERNWHALVNGALLDAAEKAGFEVLLTCDKNWQYQQNLTARRIGVVVLPTNIWAALQPLVAEIGAAILAVAQGGFHELPTPRRPLRRRLPPP